MKAFPWQLWAIAAKESILWLLEFEPPVRPNVILKFGTPRKMQPPEVAEGTDVPAEKEL